MHRAVPLIEWNAVRYSVPPELLGAMVECRREVGSDTLQIRYGGSTVATHVLAPKGSDDVWNQGHSATAQSAALGRKPDLSVVGEPVGTIDNADNTIDVPGGDYVVEQIDLDRRVGGVQ